MARAVLVCFLWSALAHAAATRVRWRGVEALGGPAPPRLESATSAHLALALRPLGAGLVPGPPFDAEAVARCSFAVARRAQCQVEVVAGELRAERRSEVPYRDADDLAESIALLIGGMLQTDFADLPQQLEIEPEPPPRPPPPPKVPPPAPPSPKVPPPAPPPLQTTTTRPERRHSALAKPAGRDQGQLLVSVGPSVAVGFSGDPPLAGATVRALYLSRRVLRAGGTLALEGTDVSRGGYQLSFFRLLAAPRIGVGLTQGRVDVDLTVGPGLHVLHGEAAGLEHTLTTVALAAGARLGVLAGSHLWVEAGLDVVGSLDDEKVAAGPTPVTSFGHWWLDLAVALVYRP